MLFDESTNSELIHDDEATNGGVSRRAVLRLGAVGATGVALTAAGEFGAPYLAQKGLLSTDGAFAATATALGDLLFYKEKFPTSPLILTPFIDPLPIPKALAPEKMLKVADWSDVPGPGVGQQNSLRNERHQKWSSDVNSPDPIVYKIELKVATHSFTTSEVLPINALGQPAVSFDATGKRYPVGTKRKLPESTIYGFNGVFPGPMINAEYGKPVLVRFENHLDENELGLDRQDFGSPDWSFLTHLHNGHTAPESDGNPHYSMNFGPQREGYLPGEWVDNLYLNWPAGGDDREKQTFFWFHDHRMDHTGSNVYKGMVGLYPIYDPKDGMDMGDETKGLRLPGCPHRQPGRQLRCRVRHPAGHLRLPARRRGDAAPGHPRRDGPVPRGGQPGQAPQVVGQDVLQALPQPRLRRRHLHRQRHRQPGPRGEAPQVPAAVPRRLGRADLRLPADVLDPGPEDGGVARLLRQRAPGPVPHPRRPAVHEVHRGRHGRRSAAGPDPAGQLRAVARQAAGGRRRLLQVHGRDAHDEGRRHLPDQHDEDARRPDVDQLGAVHPGPQLQGADDEDRHRRRRPRQQRDPREAARRTAAAGRLEDA